jgi:hypothetical protein
MNAAGPVRLQVRHASLFGGGPRNSSGNLAKFAAMRRASSRVSPIGRRAALRKASYAALA